MQYNGEYQPWSESKPRLKEIKPYDLSKRWMIAGTESASSNWHTDSCGYGTFVHVLTGVKLWTLYTPNPKSDAHQPLSTLTAGEGMEIEGYPLLLYPGDSM